MNDLSSFKEYELFPSLFERIDTAFPELHFKRIGNRWESKYHLNGEKDSQGKVISNVYGNSKYMAIDHSTDEKRGLIDLYMSLNGADFQTALRELSDICGLTPPSGEGEAWENYKNYERTQANRENANKTFVSALWGGSAEAEKVLSYLHGRGWTDEEIKRAELGLITSEIRAALPDGDSYKGVVKDKEDRVIGGVGTTHLLTIPYRNGSRLFGFKFREVGASTGTKYLNTYGLQKSSGLFGIGIGVKDLVIVEGELDALHAKVKGADNIAATTGGKASETQIKDAIRRGVERFTLLFDNDERGRSFIAPTIETIRKEGKSIYVATLPEGKDLDEFLSLYSLQDYTDIVKGATPYPLYVLGDIASTYEKKEGEDGLTLKDREGFFSDVEKLLNSPLTKPQDRELIYKALEQYEEPLLFKVEDIRAYIDKGYLREREKDRTEAALDASKKIAEALEKGRTDEALRIMRETAASQNVEERAAEYARVFAPSSPQEYARQLSEVRDGIPTGFKFEQYRQSEPLTLNVGLTFICGYRGHGKTSFLNNIALNEARRNVALRNGKSVLYFSYEVEKRRLIADLLNTFVNDAEISRHPSDSILSYFRGKGSKYFKNGSRSDGLTHYQNFLQRKDVFLRDYLSSGALTIVDESYKVEQLLEAIKYYTSTRSVSVVCIDYAQLIYSEDYSRQRTEEIKKVVNDIKDFANKEGLPFVMAAQFNREVNSPVSVDTKNIGEGGDFERIADTCIGLFNLKELHPLPSLREEESNAKKLLSDLGVESYAQGDQLRPIQGKLFVRLMKRRYGYYPLDTILDWEGSTKYIKPNFEKALDTEGEQLNIFDIENEEEEDAPF